MKACLVHSNSFAFLIFVSVKNYMNKSQTNAFAKEIYIFTTNTIHNCIRWACLLNSALQLYMIQENRTRFHQNYKTKLKYKKYFTLTTVIWRLELLLISRNGLSVCVSNKIFQVMRSVYEIKFVMKGSVTKVIFTVRYGI